MPGGVEEQAEAYLADIGLAVAEYRRRNTHGTTLVISSDAARELLPGYSTPAERLRNNYRLGPASSRLAAAVWEHAIRLGPIQQRPGVQFLTGCPGSGKTQSLAGLEGIELPSSIVSEAMMDDVAYSTRRIEQALAAGFLPSIRLVYADDPRTNLRRAVLRANDFGRPVRVAQMIRLYTAIPLTVERLAVSFGQRLGIVVHQNSIDNRPAQRSTLGEAIARTQAYTQEDVTEAMSDELHRLRRTGQTSEEIVEAFLGALGRNDPAATSGR